MKKGPAPRDRAFSVEPPVNRTLFESLARPGMFSKCAGRPRFSSTPISEHPFGSCAICAQNALTGQPRGASDRCTRQRCTHVAHTNYTGPRDHQDPQATRQAQKEAHEPDHRPHRSHHTQKHHRHPFESLRSGPAGEADAPGGNQGRCDPSCLARVGTSRMGASCAGGCGTHRCQW